MRRRRFWIFAAILALLAANRPVRAEYRADFVRLHVVAASDSAEDQAVKLRVRDACLRCARELLSDCPDADAAYVALRENRAAFLRVARVAAAEAGSAGPVRAETGVFAFPDRFYGDLFLPAGEYRALRVVIGAGGGHNWWCVLYPSLCLLDEGVYASGTEPEVEFYSSVWEWMQNLFHS